MVCYKCKEEIPDNVKYCPICGSIQVKRCYKCGAEMSIGAGFCSQCGFDNSESNIEKEERIKQERTISRNTVRKKQAKIIRKWIISIVIVLIVICSVLQVIRTIETYKHFTGKILKDVITNDYTLSDSERKKQQEQINKQICNCFWGGEVFSYYIENGSAYVQSVKTLCYYSDGTAYFFFMDGDNHIVDNSYITSLEKNYLYDEKSSGIIKEQINRSSTVSTTKVDLPGNASDWYLLSSAIYKKYLYNSIIKEKEKAFLKEKATIRPSLFFKPKENGYIMTSSGLILTWDGKIKSEN